MLSGAEASRSEASAESKHPYSLPRHPEEEALVRCLHFHAVANPELRGRSLHRSRCSDTKAVARDLDVVDIGRTVSLNSEIFSRNQLVERSGFAFTGLVPSFGVCDS